METARTRALSQLVQKIPGQNEQLAQQMNRTNEIQMRGLLNQAPQGTGVRQTQAAGAQLASQAGQQQLGIQKQAGQTANQIGQMGLASQQQAGQVDVGQKKLGLQKESRALEEGLSGLGEKLKSELFDKQMQFKQDETGRAVLNERQLQDWARQKAKSSEEYKSYAQNAQLVYQRKNQMMDIALQKLSQALDNEQKFFGQNLDQETRKQLTQMKVQADKDAQKRQADAANKALIWQTGGAIVGGIAGGMAGGPTGAIAGSQVVGGLGTIAASKT